MRRIERHNRFSWISRNYYVYRQAATSSGHTAGTVDDCLNGLSVVVGEGCAVGEVEALGVAELRFDLALDAALRIVG